MDHLAAAHVPGAGPLDAAIGIHERVVELQDDAARRALTTRESLDRGHHHRRLRRYVLADFAAEALGAASFSLIASVTNPITETSRITQCNLRSR